MNYANIQGICQFARVFHVRDFICAYACILHALRAFSYASRKPGASPAGAGSPTLLPVRHEHMPGRLEATRGAAVGGVIPPSSNHSGESVANGAFPIISRVRKRTHRACVSARPGTVQYLMITVPIDTMFSINDLQIILQKTWCHFVLFQLERI